MDVHSNKKGGQYVHEVILVQGKEFYGYHDEHSVFLKIFVFSPFHVAPMAKLLFDGAIMDTRFQTFESHIPYWLQFCVDFNLFGMGYINLTQARFRLPIPSLSDVQQRRNTSQLLSLSQGTTVASKPKNRWWYEVPSR